MKVVLYIEYRLVQQDGTTPSPSTQVTVSNGSLISAFFRLPPVDSRHQTFNFFPELPPLATDT
jgi:hypothetical protein